MGGGARLEFEYGEAKLSMEQDARFEQSWN
jgi:hypothetical protein